MNLTKILPVMRDIKAIAFSTECGTLELELEPKSSKFEENTSFWDKS